VTAVNKAGFESAPASIDLSPSHTGPIWWVATNGSDQNGDGSVGGPLASIQEAMGKAASGDTVMLKPGTYNFNEMNYPILAFDNATENYSQISFEKLVIRSEKGAASTIIDANNQGRHFMIRASENQPVDSTFKFMGLTFRGGRSERGGSILIETYSNSPNGFISNDVLARPKFEDCRFVDNRVGDNNSFGDGGAIMAYNATPIFENCVFDSNYANQGGAISYAGNIDSDLNTSYIRNSTFNGNVAFSNNNSESLGGAIAIMNGQDFIITNSTFNENFAAGSFNSSRGGAIYASNQWDPLQDAPILKYQIHGSLKMLL